MKPGMEWVWVAHSRVCVAGIPVFSATRWRTRADISGETIRLSSEITAAISLPTRSTSALAAAGWRMPLIGRFP
jgi:hypothetical protein